MRFSTANQDAWQHILCNKIKNKLQNQYALNKINAKAIENQYKIDTNSIQSPYKSKANQNKINTKSIET